MLRARTRFFALCVLAMSALLAVGLTPLLALAADDQPAQPAVTPAAPESAGAAAAPQAAGGAVLPSTDTTAPEGAAQAPHPAAVSERPLTPMHAEIKAALDTEKAQVVELQTRLQTTTDATAALEIQKQVEHLKFQTEISILQIQARYAHQEGHADVAAQLEASIREMTSPKAPGKPIDRPAPQQAPATGSKQQ